MINSVPNRCIFVVLVAAKMIFLAACTTPSQDGQKSIQDISKRWRQIDSDTPIFYPTDYKPEGAADYKSGEWVYAGSAAFFIPKNGTVSATNSQLTSEALALRKKYGGRQSTPSGAPGKLSVPSYEDFLNLLRIGVYVPMSAAAILGGGDPADLEPLSPLE